MVEVGDILITKNDFVCLIIRDENQKLRGRAMDGINYINNPQYYIDNNCGTLYKKNEWECVLQEKDK